MFLIYTHDPKKPPIQEMDEFRISVHKSKGWVETVPPEFSPDTQAPPTWNNEAREWTVRDLTAEEIAAKSRKIWPTAGDFWAAFSPGEQEAIITSENVYVKLIDRQLVLWRGEVWSDDPRINAGLNALEQMGILTPERKAVILSKPK